MFLRPNTINNIVNFRLLYTRPNLAEHVKFEPGWLKLSCNSNISILVFVNGVMTKDDKQLAFLVHVSSAKCHSLEELVLLSITSFGVF